MPDLHSKPGASKRIHLVFTGRSAQTWSFGVNVPDTPAWGTGSERQIAWATAAEKYAPFDVDVTTEPPHDLAAGVAMEVIVGGAGAWNLGQGTGTTNFGSFLAGFWDQRNYVFPDALNGTPEQVGIIIAHEVGHAMGLHHQSSANNVDDYVGIDSTKSPIMGLPFTGRAIWWSGPSYPSGPQNDLTLLASALSYTTAVDGLIRNIGETRTHSITHTGGNLTVTVAVPTYGAMLDPSLIVKDFGGTTVASADSASAGSPATWGESVTVSTPAGTYSVIVGSHGQTGDIGSYTLTYSSSVGGVATFNLHHLRPIVVSQSATAGHPVFV